MTYSNAIILGLVQGLTEFLPVSSSGHLVLMQHLLPNLEGAGLAFDTTLHLATLITVLIYFRTDIIAIIKGLFGKEESGENSLSVSDARKIALLITIGTIPTGIIGLAFKDQFESLFSKPALVGCMLLVTGTILLLAERWGRKKTLHKKADTTLWTDALAIGIAQGMAVTPGISRAGSTIATGLFCSLDRSWAAKFSFLISIPAISGAFLLQSKAIIGILTEPGMLMPAIVGMLTAGLSGYLAIDALLKLISKNRLIVFSFYCWIIGIGAIVHFI